MVFEEFDEMHQTARFIEYNKLLTRIAEIEGENERRKKDSRRINWATATHVDMCFFPEKGFEPAYWEVNDGRSQDKAASLREAIDATLAAGETE